MQKEVYEYISQKMNDPIIEWKTCLRTGQKFPIFQKDKELLEKISPKIWGKKYDLPLPNLSPEAREIRRLMRRNDRKIYKTKCQNTNKDLITFYHPDIEQKIVEFNERFKNIDNTDGWQDFDINKTINQQLEELIKKTTKENVLNVGIIENSKYTHNAWDMKNCYMVFDTGVVEDSFYGVRVANAKKVVDGFEIHDSENIYQSMSIYKSNMIFFSQNCESCNYSAFISYCEWCNYCIWCTNLINKSYYIFNQPVSKEQYESTRKELFDGNMTTIQNFENKYQELLQKNPKKALNIINCENSIGNNLINCKNVFLSDEMKDVENFRYSDRITNDTKTADSMDISSRWRSMNNCYELNCSWAWIGTTSYNNQFGSYLFWWVSNTQYCVNITRNSEYLFACSDIRDKKYCILNKQYTKEAYEELVPKIIEHMQQRGERWEFFDSSISPFPYNDTIANDFYPIKPEQLTILEPEKIISNALIDFWWTEKVKVKRRTKEQEINVPEGMASILAKDIPNNIWEIKDDILDKAIICEISNRPFRIVWPELAFYRKHSLPLPRKHPDIRHIEKVQKRPGKELYLKKCDKCQQEMISVYWENSPYKVYCETCYNKEIYW